MLSYILVGIINFIFGIVMAFTSLYFRQKYLNIVDKNNAIRIMVDELKYNIEYFNIIKVQHEATLNNIKEKKVVVWME